MSFLEKTLPSITAVKSSDEFQHAKNIIKDNGENFFTNLYAGEDILRRWIIRGQIFSVTTDKSLFIFRLRRGFWHLYFMANDLDIFSNELSRLTENINSTVSTDIIQPGSENDAMADCFGKARFKKYITLTRMSRLNKPAASTTNSEWFARLNDVHGVYEIINENMDPLCEQIPDIEEIATAIQNHQILVARHQSDVAAILYFERTGVSTTLRFWATGKKYQGHGFGSMVYERYLSTNADAKRWLLWVRDDNSKVKQIYQKYGMTYEKLNDSVWIRTP